MNSGSLGFDFSSVALRLRPASPAHRFDNGHWREVVEVAGGGGDAGVAELAGDDGDVDAFGAELGRVRVAESVGVDALVDAGPSGETLEHDADISGGHQPAVERAEYRVPAEGLPRSRTVTV